MTNPKATRAPIDPKISTLASKHKRNPEAILEIFLELQSQQNILTQDSIADIARSMKVSESSAFGVASFYSMLSLSQQQKHILRVCDGPVCWLHGAETVLDAVKLEFGDHPEWTVERNSCLGLCNRTPAALLDEKQIGPITSEEIRKLTDGWLGEPSDYSLPRRGEKRVMLEKAGMIDPDSLDSALEYGAYQALRISLDRDPESLLEEALSAGLTGRGGAGFPTGQKARFVMQEENTPKYVICNADESEPLIFKDRVLIDTNPHQLLEGMAIAAYTVGATEGYIYIRGEYESQAKLLENAIQQAKAAGWLGDRIQESAFSFHVHVHRGAGAYICGEETALIESLEGKRGEPRVRPPYPPSNGFRGQPTLVNNVETFASMPSIILHGADWYRALSDWRTPGTKIYMVLGHVNQPGLFEAPFGLTLRQVIDEFGGGMRPGSSFQFALTGGAAGTIVPPSLIDIPIDYGSGAEGVSLGAGAFLICDQSVSVVALLRELMHFFMLESCGKCTPCRVGTHQAHVILSHLSAGEGQPDAITELLALADNLLDASFCGLGQSAAIPIHTAIKHFPNKFQSAILGKE